MVFLDIHNAGNQERTLISVHSSAGVAELHSMSKDDGIMRMRPIKSVKIPAGETVSFRSGEMHIMLTQLKAPLKEGEHITLSLGFDNGEMVAAEIPVSVSATSEGKESSTTEDDDDMHHHEH